jgi:transposase
VDHVLRQGAGRGIQAIVVYPMNALANSQQGELGKFIVLGYPEGKEHVLKHSRWCLLKRPKHLTQKQTVKMAELLRYNLRTVRGYLHREDFQRFWTYMVPWNARRFLREWCGRVMRSQLEPLKKIAQSLRDHEPLILNWFRAPGTISTGVVEGFNNKAKLAMRKSCGFRTHRIIQLVLYHNLGELPEPEFTHKLW